VEQLRALVRTEQRRWIALALNPVKGLQVGFLWPRSNSLLASTEVVPTDEET